MAATNLTPRFDTGARRMFPRIAPAQRTGVQLRPHQETGRHQVATSEPVVGHHGREGGSASGHEARPSASTACWAALVAICAGAWVGVLLLAGGELRA